MQTIFQHYDLIDSTSALALRLAHMWRRDALTVISAREQTTGRGQQGRPWCSVKDKDLLVSYVLYSRPTPFIANLAQANSLAVVDVLTACRVNASIKWPNDVLVNQKKIAGILVETTPVDDQLCIIIGIGFNVLSLPEHWSTISQPVTSLLDATGISRPLEHILEQLTDRVSLYTSQVLAEGFSKISAAYLEKIKYQMGEEIILSKGQRGTYAGISSEGALLLQMSSGNLQKFTSQ